MRIESDPKKWKFVHTGPTSLAGRYLRCFWQPICESANLSKGQAIPVKILGENFTLYRDEKDTPHVVGFRCPHRGTQLSAGWVEGESIRCFFHGWRFAPDGTCTEQPAEPKFFGDKIRISAYPAQEQMGLIFAYFGSGDPPPLPQWPEFESSDCASSMTLMPCNYYQSAENIVDDVHVEFAHRAIPELGKSSRGVIPPLVSARETSFGLAVTFESDTSMEQNLYIMPNICYVAYDLVFGGIPASRHQCRMKTLFWYVPVDDVSHQHVQATIGSSSVTGLMRQEIRPPTAVASEILAVLAGRSSVHKEIPVPGKRVPDLVRIQDGVAIVGQGTIADRDREHLGASDAGVILLRKIWLRELHLLEAGRNITQFTRPESLPG